MLNKKCQVFTPSKTVNELLDAVGYTENLFNKKVIESSCGRGDILKEIVRRYIKDAFNRGKTCNEIKNGLQNNIYGLEIDNTLCNECINTLNNIAKEYQITNVKWNILNKDFLKESIKHKFDYAIGNPPYIKYENLDARERLNLKEKFISCKKGKFDYYYAFIEASLYCLNNNGKLAYLIPVNMFKNTFAQELRNIILPYTVKVIDYSTQKLFNKVLTSSAILICDKSISSCSIEYQNIVKKSKCTANKKNLQGKWTFNIIQKDFKRKFGDYFKASNSVCTLSNSVYVLNKSNDFIQNRDYISFKDFKIERSLIKIGVSPKSLSLKKNELILFPYKYDEKGNLIRYKVEEFENKFPEASKYLKYNINKLNKRASENNIKWFEYGRSQALNHLNQNKLLISHIITKKVNVYELDKECIPYSGIYITQTKNLSLSQAKELLENENFYNYVKTIGTVLNGDSLYITVKDLNDYMF